MNTYMSISNVLTQLTKSNQQHELKIFSGTNDSNQSLEEKLSSICHNFPIFIKIMSPQWSNLCTILKFQKFKKIRRACQRI